MCRNLSAYLEGYPTQRLVVCSNVKENRGVFVGGSRAAAVHASGRKRQ